MLDPLDWRGRVRRWSPPLPRLGALPLGDVGLAVFFLLCALVDASFIWDYGASPTYLLNTALPLVIAVASLQRHTAVVHSFVVTYLALGALAALVWITPVSLGLDPVIFAAPFSLWAVTRWAPHRGWGLAGLLIGIVGGLFNPAVPAFGFEAQRLVVFGLPAVIIIAATYAFAAWLRSTAETHAAEVHTAMATSRLELSRELHDVVGHGLTAIRIQAQTALYLDEAANQEVLAAISATAEAALHDTHALVDALRGGEEISADPAAIPRIVQAVLPPGGAIEITMPPSFAPLANWPLARRLALVRAVTEIATNMAKYATGAGRLEISIDSTATEISTAATDQVARAGKGVKPPSARSDAEGTQVRILSYNHSSPHPDISRQGAGLAGLRERFRELGGTFSYRATDTTFLVEAIL